MTDGTLNKLRITPFEDSENVQLGSPAGDPFVAQFNPETLTINNEIEFDSDVPAHGDDGKEAKFKAIKPRSVSFEFLLDGTGATGEKQEVEDQIDLFKKTVGFSGKIHRPLFLVLNWGKFTATCVLESFSITYKLFRPDGTALRAVLAAKFKEHKPKEVKEREENKSSPDIVHAHLVKESERLWLITYGVYKDPSYYFQVAESNQLDTLRKVETGVILYLPPVG